MRDLFLLIVFPIFIYYGLRTPIVSLCLWFWSSMYPLQNWLYGFGLSLRFNLVFSMITIVGYFLMRNKPKFKPSLLFFLIIIFSLHSGIGVALYGFYDGMWDKFYDFLKTIIFFIFTILLLRKKEHFEAFLAFLWLALCFYGSLEGLKVLATGGGHKLIGIHGPLGDNNKVALGLNMCIPLILYLTSQFNNKYIKLVLKASAFLCVCAILGTGSRGGLIGLIFMAAYYWWRNGKKLSILFVFSIVAISIISFLPDSWHARMGTLKSAGQESSMVSRVTSWKINLLAGIDHPFVGHGFNATAAKIVWQDYVYDLDSLDWGVDTPIPTKGFVAHSIYFEVLGNQGFIGLFLYLLIIFLTLIKISRLNKKVFSKGSWEYNLLSSIKVAIATFCVCGAALSAAYFELLYAFVAIVLSLEMKKNTENIRRL